MSAPFPMSTDRVAKERGKALRGKGWDDSPPKLKVLDGGCFERMTQINLEGTQGEDSIPGLSGCLSRQCSCLVM